MLLVLRQPGLLTRGKGVRAAIRRVVAHGRVQLRQAGLVTGLAAVLVGGAVASAPVYLDRAAGDLITREVAHVGLDQRPALSMAMSVSGFRANPGWVTEASASLRASLERVPSLDPPVLTVVGDDVTVAGAGPATLAARVVGRDGVGANLDLLAGDARATGGVWLAEQHAADLGVTAGDTLAVVSGPSSFDVAVAGVHADLLAAPSARTRSYWRPVAGVLRPARPVAGGDPGRPAAQRPALLGEPATALEITRGALGEAVVRWESALASGELTLAEARRLRTDVEALQRAVLARDEPLGRAFGRMGPPPVVSSPVLAAVDRALDSLALASGGVRTMQLAGGLLSIAVLAALVAYRVRAQEVAVERDLALGLSPQRVAWSLVWPLLPVVVAGIAGGALVSAVAIGASADGLRQAAVHCSAATVAAAAASWGAGLVAVWRVQGVRSRARGRAFAWDVPVLALAAAAGYQLVLRGSALVEGPGGLRLDVLVLAFPLLALGAAAGLLVRGARRVLPRLRDRGERLPVAAFLALRRVGHPRGRALLLLGFATATIGLSSYGGALASSAAAAERAKARTNLGSDLVVALPRDARLAALPDGTTLVGRATGRLATRTEQVQVMAVDPDTLLEAATWHDEFSPTGGATLLSRLREPATDGVPAVLVGVPDDGPVRFVWRGTDVRLRPVGTARDLPGRSGRGPVVLVSVHRLEQAVSQRDPDARIDRLLDRELWVAGDEDVLAEALPAGLLATLDVRTLADVRADPALHALRWTLGYLRVVGALAVVLALAAAAGRTVSLRGEQAAAVVIGDRLGMGTATHARAAAIELAAVLAVAVTAGWLAGTGVAALVAPLLDPLPSLPPRPAPRLAPGTLLVASVAGLVTTCLGAAAAHRHARRLAPAEHLRAGV